MLSRLVTDWAKVVVAENNPMSDEIPFLIREPLSRALGISNENWRQPADYRGRIDLTCGFENFLSLSTGPPSRPACLSRKPVSGLSLNSTSAPTLSPKTNNRQNLCVEKLGRTW